MLLSKSLFLQGHDCERRLWLYLRHPELRLEFSEADEERVQMRRYLGLLARQAHPEGQEVLRRQTLDEDARATRELIEQGSTCLFEATFIANGCAARVDILKLEDGAWTINEVKSSTIKPPSKISPDKMLDLTFQLMTVRASGLHVRAARLVLVDSAYASAGAASVDHRMLVPLDLTEQCEKLLQQVESRVADLSQALAEPSEPDVEINTHCKQCDFVSHCVRKTGSRHVIYLPRISPKDVRSLTIKGVQTITEIPEDHPMNERQRRVREAFVSGRPWIGEALGEALDKIRYPAIFLDFETTSSAIPTYPGTRPYQQVCFQWSAHVLGSESGKPVHHEFLACDEADPRAEFCRSLWKLLRKCDSIVHYTAFEISQIRGMAEEGVPLAAELLQAFSARSLDLEKLVAEHVYFESFCGRTSIKVVLPTLVPGMSYKNLRISDGNAAATAFRKMLAKAEEAPELRSALLEYCCQDTLAMVEIYRALRRLAKQPALF